MTRSFVQVVRETGTHETHARSILGSPASDFLLCGEKYDAAKLDYVDNYDDLMRAMMDTTCEGCLDKMRDVSREAFERVFSEA